MKPPARLNGFLFDPITLVHMKRLLPLLFLLSFSVQAQELLHCGADEMRIQTLQANPKIAEAVIKRDAELDAFTREYESTSAERSGNVYLIPVVFHVIHKYGTENISREQILDGLRILNETFRKTREDTADIVAAFKPLHADCEIEFRLATKDPDGNCHSGINRIASDLTNSGDHRVKELIHWDPTMYLNVYIVSNAAGLAGHCVWPADADTIPEWDGIVIAHNYVGTIGTSNLTTSVAFAHECGHYLNLQHIWGGNNVPDFYYLPVGQQSNCGEDDQVADTPNTIGWSNCNLNALSCGNTVDMVQNAMDYSYCNIMFTEGQKTRMHACLNSTIAHRNNLWSQSNLIATGVLPEPAPLCEADFAADKRVLCTALDNEVMFTQISYHGDIDSLVWTFENGTPSTSSDMAPTVAYTQPGQHDVSLTVYANGQSKQVSKNGYVTVLPSASQSYPFWDWFEGGAPMNASVWTEYSFDEDNRWVLTDVGYYSANHSVMVDNWENDLLTVDELYSPPIDISGASQMRMAFRYAFASNDEAASNSTKLQVQVRKNCESNWATRLNVSGSSLETAVPQSQPFEPTDALQWNWEDINIPSSYFSEDFRFRFVFTSGGHNRLFIDDVNVDIAAGVNEEDGEMALSLYPNPVNDRLYVSFELKEPQQTDFEVIDAIGRTVIVRSSFPGNLGRNTRQIDTSALGSGVYFLQVGTESSVNIKRFIRF